MRGGRHPGHRRRDRLRNGVCDDGAAAGDVVNRVAGNPDRDQVSGPEHAGDRGHRGEVQRDVGSGCHGDVQLCRQFAHRLGLQGIHLARRKRRVRADLSRRPAPARAAGAETVSKMQTTSARLISSVPQVLQGLASPGASSSLGLSQAGLDSAASLGSSGVPAPISALSSLASTSGEGATKGASAGLGTLSGLATNLASVLSGNSLATLGRGSDLVGLGSDGAGFGADGGGLGFDAYRRSMDFQGAGSILGAEGVPGFETSGELGGNLPLGRLDQGPAAGLGHANALGTLSVPPKLGRRGVKYHPGFRTWCVSPTTGRGTFRKFGRWLSVPRTNPHGSSKAVE